MELSIHSLPKEGDQEWEQGSVQTISFNPLPPQGGRPLHLRTQPPVCQPFNPLPPQGGRPSRAGRKTMTVKTFNPLPPQGGRLTFPLSCIITSDFNPLPPQGGRHNLTAEQAAEIIFQSTPSPRRETISASLGFFAYAISIHSLPKEGDADDKETEDKETISIHSLPKEGDATQTVLCNPLKYFNPLPPQGGRLLSFYFSKKSVCISIHSLPKEGDHRRYFNNCTYCTFQSTPSPRRET